MEQLFNLWIKSPCTVNASRSQIGVIMGRVQDETRSTRRHYDVKRTSRHELVVKYISGKQSTVSLSNDVLALMNPSTPYHGRYPS
jgi:hypothetical protein